MELRTEGRTAGHHPRRRRVGFFWDKRRRRRYHPRRRRAGCFSSIPRQRARSVWDRESLRFRYSAGELVAEVLKVIRADPQLQHFLNHGQEISQRANRAQEWRIGWPKQTTRGGQHQGIFDHLHRQTALIQLCGQQAVGATDRARGPRRLPVGLQHLTNIFLLAVVVHVLSPAVHTTTARQCAPCGTDAAGVSITPPPWAGCPESWAIRHTRDSL